MAIPTQYKIVWDCFVATLLAMTDLKNICRGLARRSPHIADEAELFRQVRGEIFVTLLCITLAMVLDYLSLACGNNYTSLPSLLGGTGGSYPP